MQVNQILDPISPLHAIDGAPRQALASTFENQKYDEELSVKELYFLIKFNRKGSTYVTAVAQRRRHGVVARWQL